MQDVEYYMYVYVYSYVCIYYREIYQASRWLEDPRFFSPMVDTSVGHVFVHDFVQFQFQGAVTLGRVSRFLYKVRICIYSKNQERV